jgi:hypothetical protein
MPTQLFPLNAAEVIFAPLHDPEISPSLGCSVVGHDGALGPRLEHGWCWTIVQWQSAKPDAPAVTFEIPRLQIALDRFDELIFCTQLPAKTTVTLAALLDGHWQSLGQATVGRGDRMEIVRKLPAGARQLQAVRAIFSASDDLPRKLGMSWMGLAESSLRDRLLSVKTPWDPSWPGLIVPRDQRDPSAPFMRGLLFDRADLPRLRHKAKLPGWRDHIALIRERANGAMKKQPEDFIGDFVPWSDTRYLREREHGAENLFRDLMDVSFIGVLDDNANMIDHALRFLMAHLHTTHWCQSQESRLRGCAWDQRCFVEELTTTAVALAMDWLAPAMTNRAKNLGLLAMWDKGLSIIERDMYKWDYVYNMNQGPWFCRARVLGGLLLEKNWSHLGDYVGRAVADLRTGLNNYVLPDGGTDEGAMYFGATLHAAAPALWVYARARSIDVASLLPPQLAKSDLFIATLSGVRPGTLLLDGDNTTDFPLDDSFAILAGMYPDSLYHDVLGKTLGKEQPGSYIGQYVSKGVFGFVIGPDTFPTPRCIVPTFSVLPNAGAMTSLRRDVTKPGGAERSTRVHIAGCKADASHVHMDKGGFTIELDGQLMLIDRGTVRYDDARGQHLGSTAMHNCLTPCFDGASFPIQDRATQAVIPSGKGDETTLRAEINLSHVWRDVLASCSRSWVSMNPSHITVRDAGRLLEQPGQLVCHYHSTFAFTIDADKRAATLRDPESGATLRISAPWAERVDAEIDSINHRYEPVWHLRIWSPRLPGGASFDLSTEIIRIDE